MPTQAEINYLNSLHQQEINKYLTAYNNATPEQKAAINQTINPTSQPVAPPASTPVQTTPTTPASTGGPSSVSGQNGLVSDGQGGFIPVGNVVFGDHYGIVSKLPDGRVALNGPTGVSSYASEALAREAAAQMGIPYQPALPITGTATPDEMNAYLYGVNADGTPSNAQQQQAYIAGMNPDESKKKEDSSLDKGALAYLTDLLKKYGLDSLAPWAMDMLKSGASQYEIIQQLRERPEYKARFAGMDERRAKGLGPLSEEEYMAFENTTKDYMQRAGLPASLYDQPSDFASLIGNFANVGQVADRIEKGYQQVAQAPIEVRQEMQKWFGVDGDNALAGFFLDPERNLPLLERAAQQAVIGGYGLRQGLDISQNQAGNLADMGFTTQQIQSGMQQAGTMAGLQNQTVDEAAAKAAGLTADTIAGGVFGADAATTQDLKNRLGTRKAQFDTRGTAGATQKGAFGLEAAR